jgi:UDP-N-acetylmuramate dehydrogenase
MEILRNHSLSNYHTFGTAVSAEYFAAFHSREELQELLPFALKHGSPPPLVLGGGSNLLFTKNFSGFVLKNNLKGIEKVKEDEQHVYIRIDAGEKWDDAVQYCLAHNYAGIENLSLIPGNTGASPIQNIGAYGVEIKDVFHELEAFHTRDQFFQTFNASECAFGYRESVFKNRYKNEFIILSVTLRLDKKPTLKLAYGAILQELEKMQIQKPTISDVSKAIIKIRQGKLPNPAIIGNAGSFFKNPIVPKRLFDTIKKNYPDLTGYPIDHADEIKIPAGWLIEQCGWKGYRKGDAGCYEKQALVLVNYGKASGNDLFSLSEEIIESVQTRFGVNLEREVNIY